jgi:hypothetical protein
VGDFNDMKNWRIYPKITKLVELTLEKAKKKISKFLMEKQPKFLEKNITDLDSNRSRREK